MKANRSSLVFLCIGVLTCLIGITLIVAASFSMEKKCKNQSNENEDTETSILMEETELEKTNTKTCIPIDNGERKQFAREVCDSSVEAERVDLYERIETVMDDYYALYPNNIYWHLYAGGDDLKQFRPYNASPSAIKYRSDEAARLYEEIAALRSTIDTEKLMPRELKSLIQLLHFLRSNFGQPFGDNYYNGDWMLGPSRFCLEPICAIGMDLSYHFDTHVSSWQPSTYADVMYIVEQLRGYKDTIYQYILNMKHGIAAGMVRSVEQCEAGYFSFANQYRQVSASGKTGILKESFASGLISEKYFKNVNDNDTLEWERDFNESMRKTVKRTLVEYFGAPLTELMNYLKSEYSIYCVPENISSGLATLPIKYIYVNGTRTENRTTQKLPSGEMLNGSRTYENILYYYTTSSELTPDRIHELGREKLKTLYAEARKVAKNFEGLSETRSVEKFKKLLEKQSNYFNKKPFPANESGEIAFHACSNLKKAKVFCPKRFEAFQEWSKSVRETLSFIEPKTVDMFYFNGIKKTTPSCPVEVVPNFNPKSGSQSYTNSNYHCDHPSVYRLPFFMDNMGPKYNMFSVAGHEATPGHHTQLQGSVENFMGDCDDVIDWLNMVTHYPLFTEGWALYAENPLLSQETSIYEDHPLQKYGMLKWQIWRALRLIVDTGLHYRGMSRKEALDFHAQYAWDKTDKATKDVTRYQSNPAQATAYMLGQLEIWSLRNLTQRRFEEAGIKFNKKEFHHQVLSQGASPLEYLRIHIKKYIKCVVSGSQQCHELATATADGRVRRSVHKKHLLLSKYRITHTHLD